MGWHEVRFCEIFPQQLRIYKEISIREPMPNVHT